MIMEIIYKKLIYLKIEPVKLVNGNKLGPLVFHLCLMNNTIFKFFL